MTKFDETELLTLFDVDDSFHDSNTSFGNRAYKYVRDEGMVVSLGFNEHASDQFITLSIKSGQRQSTAHIEY